LAFWLMGGGTPKLNNYNTHEHFFDNSFSFFLFLITRREENNNNNKKKKKKGIVKRAFGALNWF
jgi:hypothetical protein